VSFTQKPLQFREACSLGQTWNGWLHVCLKDLIVNKVPPPKKKMSVKFTCALFSLLDFLTFEDGADGMS